MLLGFSWIYIERRNGVITVHFWQVLIQWLYCWLEIYIYELFGPISRQCSISMPPFDGIEKWDIGVKWVNNIAHINSFMTEFSII